MNNLFRGFTSVFKFNFANHTKSSKYKAVTILFALTLMLGLGAVIYFVFSPDSEADEESAKISKVYVCNETEVAIPSYDKLGDLMGIEDYNDVEFEKCDGTGAEVQTDIEDHGEYNYILAVQTKQEDGYVIYIIRGSECRVPDEDINSLGMFMSNAFRGYLYQMTGLSEDTLYQILLPVSGSVAEFNEEEEDGGKEIFRIVMIFLMVIVVYFIVMIYGMQVCSDVSMEKTSKLTEQLLISVSPYGLVSGKITAVIASSLIQFIIWVIAALAGIFGGDYLLRQSYGLETSVVSELWGMLKEWFVGTDFGIPAIVIGILAALIGISLFLILAGLGGSFVSKPEEAANMQGVYMLPMIVCYFIVIFALVNHEGNLPLVYYLIPFTGAFVTPGAMMTGAISLVMGIVAVVISIVTCALLMFAAAKIYKGMLFFNGDKVKPGEVVKFIFSK